MFTCSRYQVDQRAGLTTDSSKALGIGSSPTDACMFVVINSFGASYLSTHFGNKKNSVGVISGLFLLDLPLLVPEDFVIK